MKKRVIRILCAMMAAVSLLTITALAARSNFSFNVHDHTEYVVAGSGRKDNTYGHATIIPSSGDNYAAGVVFRISESRSGNDFCTSSKTRYSLTKFDISYSSGQNYEGTKYLFARRATAASSSTDDIYMNGEWQP